MLLRNMKPTLLGEKDVCKLLLLQRDFGMGINKPDIRYIIRHGVPESLSSWLQELGWAGRDGNPAQAYIFYAERDTDNACTWIQVHLQNQQAVSS